VDEVSDEHLLARGIDGFEFVHSKVGQSHAFIGFLLPLCKGVAILSHPLLDGINIIREGLGAVVFEQDVGIAHLLLILALHHHDLALKAS
jgi:hypothetical protein